MLQRVTVSFLAMAIAGGFGWMERSSAAQETPKHPTSDFDHPDKSGQTERSPVAGHHDMTLGADEIRDKLGDKWTVEERSKSSFLATRKEPAKADAKLHSKVSDEIKSLRDDYKGALASFHGDEVTLRGRIDECGDIPKAANRFAKIDGINRILIDVTCREKQSSTFGVDRNPDRNPPAARPDTIDRDRAPVSGKTETTLGANELRDKLGDKWMVEERSPSTYVATRKMASKPDSKLNKKVNDEIKSLRDDHKGMMATHQGDEVRLSGRMDDCDDIVKAAHKFAKIDGVDKIVVEATCAPKK